jgi:hypothetical protein
MRSASLVVELLAFVSRFVETNDSEIRAQSTRFAPCNSHQTFFRAIMKSPSIPAVLIMLITAASLCAGQEPSEVIGCITQTPNGSVQLQSRPSGAVFLLQSAPDVLQHLNELVRVRSRLVPNGTSNLVTKVELVNQSCASPLPSQKPVSVVGKVGEGQMAVPITSSRSAGETTPGFQTESILPQEPPSSSRAAPAKSWNSLYAPHNIAQAAQSAAIADIYAQSATRTEIVPGNTLAVDTMPEYSTAVENRINSKVSRRK